MSIVGPSFGLDEIGVFKHPIWGHPAWQYVATLVWILAAIVVASLFGWLVKNWLARLAEKTVSQVDDEIIRHMSGPLKTAVFVGIVYYGLPMFEWPSGVTRFLQVFVLVLVAISLVYGVMKMVDIAFKILEMRCDRNRYSLSREMIPAFRKIAKTIVVILGILLFCENMGVDIKTALAGLGIGGLAVALAAQDILANFFSSLVIIVDSPYRIGDQIKVKGHIGNVQSIGLRSTRLRTEEGNIVTIPNKTMAAEDIMTLARQKAAA